MEEWRDEGEEEVGRSLPALSPSPDGFWEAVCLRVHAVVLWAGCQQGSGTSRTGFREPTICTSSQLHHEGLHIDDLKLAMVSQWSNI